MMPFVSAPARRPVRWPPHPRLPPVSNHMTGGPPGQHLLENEWTTPFYRWLHVWATTSPSRTLCKPLSRRLPYPALPSASGWGWRWRNWMNHCGWTSWMMHSRWSHVTSGPRANSHQQLLLVHLQLCHNHQCSHSYSKLQCSPVVHLHSHHPHTDTSLISLGSLAPTPAPSSSIRDGCPSPPACRPSTPVACPCTLTPQALSLDTQAAC